MPAKCNANVHLAHMKDHTADIWDESEMGYIPEKKQGFVKKKIYRIIFSAIHFENISSMHTWHMHNWLGHWWYNWATCDVVQTCLHVLDDLGHWWGGERIILWSQYKLQCLKNEEKKNKNNNKNQNTISPSLK